MRALRAHIFSMLIHRFPAMFFLLCTTANKLSGYKTISL